MLGEDTVRYRIARFFGRPLLIGLRRLRGTEKPDRPSVEKLNVALDAYFPFNYRPQPVAEPEVAEDQLADVATFSIDESSDSASAVDALNQLVLKSHATWVFLVDENVVPRDRDRAVRVLLDAALEDDDVIFADESGPNAHTPILKSAAVAPHTLLSYNLVGRPALVRRRTLEDIGVFSTDAGWAFEHDAYLRLSEAGARFHHVAQILPAGQAPIAFERSHIDDDTLRVVDAALERRGWSATTEVGDFAGLVRWRVEAPEPHPSIDIIIPTRDRVDLVRQCIDAIEQKSTYDNYDIIILDNDSKDPETLAYFASCKYRVVPCPGPFNYAHIVNRGINHSSADYVLTLNNDTIVVTPDWLERMVGLASLPDVGIVGGCLLDQDGQREHESIVIAPYPQHLRTDSNYHHHDRFTAATRDVAAVTGAVQLVRREFWQSLGGMDEQLRVTMNDVDICLRSQMAGRFVVYAPEVQLYHHVSSSRGTLDPLEDRNRFIRRWDIFGSFQDPYFPESLLLLGEKIYYRFR